ncbi:pyruvate, phosphate dikinase [Methanococcoides burtonii]|uniref:pyruvate, phosphate dikinase n=1 Tax=Methanococcoides burtonii (strain DSM 6242 / NBRC 107633 / OCM 468 / ACE-M) TaxID=259564 RepID=Q12XB9_METBU|nr:pyruvate, phosphate dikinase [Methanococcoides burtonii]ABE51907.1 Pyruvate phosphate dikinase [Methanococcoides burtonii DSM 6242]
MADNKFVYIFGNNETEGKNSMKDLLGGKGANLAEMSNLGIPVPVGFTITTEVCTLYLKNGQYPPGFEEHIDNAIKQLESTTKKNFGDLKNPLLLSVRSGARVSMPGMMDTVLNLGLNDDSVVGLAAKTGNERFAYDSYRRFLTMFANVVLDIDHEKFESTLSAMKKDKNVKQDNDLEVEDLKELVEKFKTIIKDEAGKEFPQNAREQLQMAIDAVFGSWNNQRAKTYRKLNGIPGEWGTAVNVQSMVYGNMGETSGTGVAFTRDPATGEKRFFGEYLINAQGEDVVAGIRTPQPIKALKNTMPKVYDQLVDIYMKLEDHFKDMQDIEFTIEKGKLFMLQTRTGKRTAAAAIKIATEMVEEGLIDKHTALLRVEPEQIDRLLHPNIDPTSAYEVMATGLPASPGAAVGEVVFTAEHAEEMAKNGEKTILVRAETSPEDIGGMNASEGILTVRGGMTSHAAVVARGMGKPCVAGCGEITIDIKEKVFNVGDYTVKEGDIISIDGSTGNVILGKVDLILPGVTDELETILTWADEVRTLKVRTNADTPHDAEVARDFGAEGIGLCRTEHMFFGEDRIPAVREMIMAEDIESRKLALKKLLPMQREDFIGIFKAMEGFPVTIRLLDPPLHEFLPNHEEVMEKLWELESSDASQEEMDRVKKIGERIEYLKEINPMLGHRGCRLGITYPEIYEMQAQAIIEAACELSKDGMKIVPEIMIPLVSHVKELEFVKKHITSIFESVMEEMGIKLDYMVGTMIELPRAVLTADQIAKEAEFFSFGTNDLTQTTFGFSRDDAGKFLPFYLESGILEDDPFAVLDQDGVGQLVKIGIEKGRATRPDIKIGICGEHGGEPKSVKFGHNVGLDYVSCSPFRVPIARLAAAHAVLENKQ